MGRNDARHPEPRRREKRACTEATPNVDLAMTARRPRREKAEASLSVFALRDDNGGRNDICAKRVSDPPYRKGLLFPQLP